MIENLESTVDKAPASVEGRTRRVVALRITHALVGLSMHNVKIFTDVESRE